MWEIGYVVIVVHEFFILLLLCFYGEFRIFQKLGVYCCRLPRYPSVSLFVFTYFILYIFIEVLLAYKEPAHI